MSQSWTDDLGVVRRVPTVRGPLNFGKVQLHADLRDFVLRRDGDKCKHCGVAGPVDIDHIVARRHVGSHHPSNLQPLCWSCHGRKTMNVDLRSV